MNIERDIPISAFLTEAGWASARTALLAGDASNRRYLRLSQESRGAVLMDAPREKGEDIGPFVRVTDWLRQQGYSAPEILAANADDGLLLLEDLGDALFATHVQERPGDEVALYAAAVDLLVDLGRQPPPAWASPYDRTTLDRESALFSQWWLPAVADVDAKAATADLVGLLAEPTSAAAEVRDVLVLRDYHAENLIWLPDRSGNARVGLLDYQDALTGHPAYDLVSLLEDARRDTSEELRAIMRARYLAARPELDPDQFDLDYCVLGAQRNLKIIGIFARLALRDGKPRYLDLIPRVWGHLQRDLQHPALSDVRHWVTRQSPWPDADVLAALARASGNS